MRDLNSAYQHDPCSFLAWPAPAGRGRACLPAGNQPPLPLFGRERGNGSGTGRRAVRLGRVGLDGGSQDDVDLAHEVRGEADGRRAEHVVPEEIARERLPCAWTILVGRDRNAQAAPAWRPGRRGVSHLGVVDPAPGGEAGSGPSVAATPATNQPSTTNWSTSEVFRPSASSIRATRPRPPME